MPSNCTKRRIDWAPGPAALQALSIAEDLFPGLGMQAVVDRLVITGTSAYVSEHWRIPDLPGKSRNRWRLPSNLAAKVVPGKQAQNASLEPEFPGPDATQPGSRHAGAQKE